MVRLVPIYPELWTSTEAQSRSRRISQMVQQVHHKVNKLSIPPKADPRHTDSRGKWFNEFTINGSIPSA